ncbi:MAG: hypothetical protein K2Q06_12735, partial [Parvularculaceae bacterium]|nr:hypothetical protein [Parvularculaceae bacterium]
MTLCSMTGFSRAEGALEGWRWFWELKSVNGRSFEPRFRLPAGFDRLEPQLRRAAQARIARGNLNAALSLAAPQTASALRVNPAALDDALRLVAEVARRIDCDKPRPEGVLSLRGVLEGGEEIADEAAVAALDAAIAQSFDVALDQLSSMRESEGRAIGVVLAGHLDA